MNYNFMLAAEKAITELRAQADDAAASARIAKEAADSAESSARRWRRLTVVLGLVIVVLMAVSSVTGYYVAQTRNQADGLRQQAINSCQIGNDRAAGIVAAFHELVVLSEGPSPTAAVKAKAAVFEHFVKSHNQIRDCQQAYSRHAGG